MFGETLTWGSVPTIVASGVLSALVALITSRFSDREKTRLAAEQRNLEILIGARLKVYPALYSLLSDIPKAFDDSPTVSLDPLGLLKNFNQWDSQHSILMSQKTSNCCDNFRQALVKAVRDGRVPSKADRFRDLRKLAQKLELGLRSDLGIHGTKEGRWHLDQAEAEY
jgi:hypothetical protein